MAETVINNPSALRSDEGSAAAGWIVALLIVAGIILAGVYVVPRLQAPASTPDANINVTLPEGTIPSTNNSGTGNPGINSGNSGNQVQ